MAAKKSKLENQFSDDVNKHQEGEGQGQGQAQAQDLFSGVSIFVNGYTDPSADQLKRIMMTHGGVFHHYFNPRKTTHIIAINLPDAKVQRSPKSQIL